mmetsp:Transcript_34546/g.98240  ORF Transcript_34546/g.98240 Transcript_34546/m.98240 type:complete len:332 (+) Transcript_34546:358-1353(+)
MPERLGLLLVEAQTDVDEISQLHVHMFRYGHGDPLVGPLERVPVCELFHGYRRFQDDAVLVRPDGPRLGHELVLLVVHRVELRLRPTAVGEEEADHGAATALDDPERRRRLRWRPSRPSALREVHKLLEALGLLEVPRVVGERLLDDVDLGLVERGHGQVVGHHARAVVALPIAPGAPARSGRAAGGASRPRDGALARPRRRHRRRPRALPPDVARGPLAPRAAPLEARRGDVRAPLPVPGPPHGLEVRPELLRGLQSSGAREDPVQRLVAPPSRPRGGAQGEEHTDGQRPRCELAPVPNALHCRTLSPCIETLSLWGGDGGTHDLCLRDS